MSTNSKEAAELTSAAALWRALATAEMKAVEIGVQKCKSVADARADMYERTARALEIQRDTGVSVCACCHKPLSNHRYG